MEHILEYILDESGTDETECRRKMVSVRKVEGGLRSLMMLGMMRRCLYGSKTKIWKEGEVCAGGKPQRFARC